MEKKELYASISIKVPLTTYATIKYLAKEQRRSMSEVVRDFVECWLETEGVERYTLISEKELASIKEKIRAEVKAEEMEMKLF